MLRSLRALGAALGVSALAAASALAQQSFTSFESGPVRPLALSPNGQRLFVVNTPDARLEIFRVGPGGIAREASVPVGLEPVAVAARTDTEVWVVNHLSDSVSIVDAGTSPPRVVRTLIVGDEPRDIVFAGPLVSGARSRAFITAAHRGHHRPVAEAPQVDAQATTAGAGRADVWVFDAANLGATLEGTPLTRLTLLGDTPRALAASPDGSTVYAAVFHSGNGTTAVIESSVCNDSNKNDNLVAGPCTVSGVSMPGGLPNPARSAAGVPAPEVGLVVRWASGPGVCLAGLPAGQACTCTATTTTTCTQDAQCPAHPLPGSQQRCGKWQDELGRNWNGAVRFSLPDHDVFALDANALAQTASFSGVGTILFNMVVNPASGKLYVSNTEARNEVRFEGPGSFAAGFKPPGVAPTVQGRLHESRVSVIAGGVVTPRHLNKHIDYSVRPAPAAVRDASLATPLDMAVSADGTKLYVAAFGSGRIGVYDTATLENDTFDPIAGAASHLTVSGGGPAGLALDEARGRLYVLTRFDDSVSVLDLASGLETAHVPLHHREPASVVAGRPILYDARLSSSNGEASCSSCHVFGDFDSLAWDLGNPDDAVLNNPNPFRVGPVGDPDFHPMKGPMTTQTLRGMANHGPMHWRGDRTGGNDPGGSALDENTAFRKFIGAFEGLLGAAAPISNGEMQQFADFILQVTLPPNPIRAIDNGLTDVQQAGSNVYFGPNTDGGNNCNGCHALNAGQGFFGGDGFSSFEGETQHFKIAHLRNAYQKIGMFGMPAVPGISGTGAHTGDQVRGFGFLHDGTVDTVFRFLSGAVFTLTDTQQSQLEQFALAFDTNLAPVVGQQVTLSSSNAGVANPRIDLLIARAATSWPMVDTLGTPVSGARECELVVKGNLLAGPDAGARGWVRQSDGSFRSDRNVVSSDAALRALAATPGQELTYTCVPPAFTPGAAGQRAGVDRDEDGLFDGLDNCPAAANAGQGDADGDLAGDACDNCVARPNADQLDTEADGVGDVCDALCVGAPTTLAALSPSSGPVQTYVQITGTGMGASREIRFAGVAATDTFESLGALYARVPAGLAVGTQAAVEIVNPEGCRSQELRVFTVTAPASACGLLGAEPLAGLALLRLLRRRRARRRAQAR